MIKMVLNLCKKTHFFSEKLMTNTDSLITFWSIIKKKCMVCWESVKSGKTYKSVNLKVLGRWTEVDCCVYDKFPIGGEVSDAFISHFVVGKSIHFSCHRICSMWENHLSDWQNECFENWKHLFCCNCISRWCGWSVRKAGEMIVFTFYFFIPS